MEQTMTTKEVLALTIQQLRGIMIPVELSDTVGMKIKEAMNNIGICVQAMEAAQAKKAQAEKEQTKEGEDNGREADTVERDGNPGTSD